MRWVVCTALAAGLVLPVAAVASDPPRLVAALTNRVPLKQYRAGATIAVRFTVAAPGQAPGTGVPAGSVFQVQLLHPVGTPSPFTTAVGQSGRYHASIRWSGGRLVRVRILVYLNTPTGVARGYWVHLSTAKKTR